MTQPYLNNVIFAPTKTKRILAKTIDLKKYYTIS